MFSNLNFIQNKIRNRLEINIANKLCFLLQDIKRDTNISKTESILVKTFNSVIITYFLLN